RAQTPSPRRAALERQSRVCAGVPPPGEQAGEPVSHRTDRISCRVSSVRSPQYPHRFSHRGAAQAVSLGAILDGATANSKHLVVSALSPLPVLLRHPHIPEVEKVASGIARVKRSVDALLHDGQGGHMAIPTSSQPLVSRLAAHYTPLPPTAQPP